MGPRGEFGDQFVLTHFYPETQPGDSGSPVFNDKGELVGILSGAFVSTPSLSIVARVDAFGVDAT
jgi:S1-C subfamily serine protease